MNKNRAFEGRVKIERYLSIYIEGEGLTPEHAKRLVEADPEAWESGQIEPANALYWEEDIEEREPFDPHAEPSADTSPSSAGQTSDQ